MPETTCSHAPLHVAQTTARPVCGWRYLWRHGTQYHVWMIVARRILPASLLRGLAPAAPRQHPARRRRAFRPARRRRPAAFPLRRSTRSTDDLRAGSALESADNCFHLISRHALHKSPQAAGLKSGKSSSAVRASLVAELVIKSTGAGMLIRLPVALLCILNPSVAAPPRHPAGAGWMFGPALLASLSLVTACPRAASTRRCRPPYEDAQVILIASPRRQPVRVEECAHVTASPAVTKMGDGRHHVAMVNADNRRKTLVAATIELPIALSIKKRPLTPFPGERVPRSYPPSAGFPPRNVQSRAGLR